MSLTNPSAFITQLDTQFRACASWTGTTNTWYPSAPDGTSLPFAVYDAVSNRQRYAEGARGLPQNDFNISITAALTVGQMETLGENLVKELTEQYTGLYFRSVAYALSSDLGAAETAAGETGRTIVITGSCGLTA